MHSLQQYWYQRKGWLVLLWPLSLFFIVLARLRRYFLGLKAKTKPHPRPVVVIGNISVGGTGKTPLVIKLAQELHKAGLHPAVVSRGYGGKATVFPLVVTDQTDPAQCGDEAALIAQRAECPVVVDPDRLRAYLTVCENTDCDVVISDDGLQHYALARDLEIAVVDGQRMFGNEMCLPAGPLREPLSRLSQVHHVVVNQVPEGQDPDPRLKNPVGMTSRPRFLINLSSGEKKPFNGAPFKIGATVHAVSAIGNPDRFAETLQKLPYTLVRHDYPDHHLYTESDLLAIDEHQPIVMTEKDAVKCRAFVRPNHWYLASEVELPAAFITEFISEVKELVATFDARDTGQQPQQNQEKNPRPRSRSKPAVNARHKTGKKSGRNVEDETDSDTGETDD